MQVSTASRIRGTIFSGLIGFFESGVYRSLVNIYNEGMNSLGDKILFGTLATIGVAGAYFLTEELVDVGYGTHRYLRLKLKELITRNPEGKKKVREDIERMIERSNKDLVELLEQEDKL
ncbi:hypothetical protein COU61_03125 [Candidatus Pacearchaeota archaeon CG10_big_fil_rev_8_21_14_0_10_35_13]|nr:MAG: hypothetical protein COU61_03125 [Candidatus Pacearchaeota archaeon CG10_big_fil_rev_8_21_14_0_10_35_13]